MITKQTFKYYKIIAERNKKNFASSIYSSDLNMILMLCYLCCCKVSAAKATEDKRNKMGIIGKPNFEKTIKDMEVGEKGYTLPWALQFDSKSTPYLHIGCIVETKKVGAMKMPIQRTGPKPSDYDIDVRSVEYEWSCYDNDHLEELFPGIPTSRIVQLDYDKPEAYTIMESLTNILKEARQKETGQNNPEER